MIILDVQKIRTSYANKSFDHKNLGPLKIIRTINNSTYKLNLSQSISDIFLIFCTWLFHLHKSDFLPEQIIPLLPLIWFNKEVGLGENIAEEILNSKISKRRKDLVCNNVTFGAESSRSRSHVTTTNHDFTSSGLTSITALDSFSSTPLSRRRLIPPHLRHGVGVTSTYGKLFR